MRLDKTEKSLQKLELVLQQAYEQHRQFAPNEGSLNISFEQTVTTLGSYLGEVIQPHLGGKWILDQNQSYIHLGPRRLDPLGHVRLRITEGSAYNVQDYFQVLKSDISMPYNSSGNTRTMHSIPDNVQDYEINELHSSGKFTPSERSAESRE